VICEIWWMYLIGYAYSILADMIHFHKALNKVGLFKRKNEEIPQDESKDDKHILKVIKGKDHEYIYEGRDYEGIILSMMERFLYTTSWLLCLPEFVPFWLIVKGLTEWKTGEEFIDRRRSIIVNIFSLSSGIVGAMIIQQLLCHNWGIAFAIGLTHFVCAGFVSGYYYKNMPKKISGKKV